MKAILLLSLALAVLFTVGQCSGRGNCKVEEKGSTLQVLHVYSSCSPFRPSGSSSLSWEESVLQMQTKDEARLEYLSSLVAGKSAVPIASGRQMMQSPTYIVRAKIGTPPQTLLLAMDTSSDAAWIPCTGCAGCPASAHFSPPKSTTFKNVSCGAPQCHLVRTVIISGLQINQFSKIFSRNLIWIKYFNFLFILFINNIFAIYVINDSIK